MRSLPPPSKAPRATRGASSSGLHHSGLLGAVLEPGYKAGPAFWGRGCRMSEGGASEDAGAAWSAEVGSVQRGGIEHGRMAGGPRSPGEKAWARSRGPGGQRGSELSPAPAFPSWLHWWGLPEALRSLVEPRFSSLQNGGGHAAGGRGRVRTAVFPGPGVMEGARDYSGRVWRPCVCVCVCD